MAVKKISWKRLLRVIGKIALFLFLLCAASYIWGMIFYTAFFGKAGWGNGVLASLWVAAMVAVYFLIQPWKQRAIWWLSGLVMVLVPFLTITPSNDKPWRPEFARTGHGVQRGDKVTLHQVRNFHYRQEDDFDVRWETRTYTLSKLQGLDYIQSNFHGDLMAHPILSFDFGDEGKVCLTVEARREVGEEFSPFGGIYRMFEIQYLFSMEEDCVLLRSHVRKELVRRYSVEGTLEKFREMFLASLKVQNELAQQPRFYNTLSTNCVTSLRAQRPKTDRVPWDSRILFNGMLDEYLYENGLLKTNELPFDKLREQAIIRPD